jgi:hypothetical protein
MSANEYQFLLTRARSMNGRREKTISCRLICCPPGMEGWLKRVSGVMLLLVLANSLYSPLWASSVSDKIQLDERWTFQINALTHGMNFFGDSSERAGFARQLAQGDRLTNGAGDFGQGLMIWYELTSPTMINGDARNVWVYLANENGDIAGEEQIMKCRAPFVVFSCWPRRSPKLRLFLEGDHRTEFHELVVIKNPFLQPFPQWRSELLPTVKTAGDLEVTLQSFATGYEGWKIGGTMNDCVCKLLLRSTNNTTTKWSVASVVLNDATGNIITNRLLSMDESGNIAFTPALWSDEAAWKVIFEMKRLSGFETNELFMFQGMTKQLLTDDPPRLVTTNINGVSITLGCFDHHSLLELRLSHSPLPKDTHLDIISINSGGRQLHMRDGPSTENPWCYMFNCPWLTNTFDVTLAMHRSRTVEFFVKPPSHHP